ncbi:hypothetical protein RIF29_12822 [Crotalaria pallida]|uniref:Secreted protein n=1 Tax=Crotalaria pallida TaxID=3830 RepID=A0AAN9INJ6_CROPI
MAKIPLVMLVFILLVALPLRTVYSSTEDGQSATKKAATTTTQTPVVSLPKAPTEDVEEDDHTYDGPDPQVQEIERQIAAEKAAAEQKAATTTTQTPVVSPPKAPTEDVEEDDHTYDGPDPQVQEIERQIAAEKAAAKQKATPKPKQL